MARVVKILFLLAVLSGGGVWGYFWLQAREPDDGGLELIRVTRGSITEKAVAVGQIDPRFQFHVKSKIPGIVQRCLIEVGDRVEPGDPLFEIVPDPTPSELVEAERRVNTTRSAFNRAKADWNRTSELARQGILSSNELDAAREAFELARIELASAEDSLKLILAFPMEDAIDVSAPLEYAVVHMGEQEAVELAYQNRVELRQEWDALKDTERRSRVAKHGILPELNVALSFSPFGNSTDFGD